MMKHSNRFRDAVACLLIAAGLPAVAQASHYWARVIGGAGTDVPRSVQQTSDGGFVLAGYTWGSFGGDQNAWVVKLDSSGIVSWQKTFGGAAGSDWATEVRQADDGGYYVGCYSMAFGNGVEAWVLRLDSAGGVVWQRTYGGTSDDYLQSLELTGDGGCVFAGYTTSFGAAGTNVWAVKLASDATLRISGVERSRMAKDTDVYEADLLLCRRGSRLCIISVMGECRTQSDVVARILKHIKHHFEVLQLPARAPHFGPGCALLSQHRR
ncbi:MAG: hypothetical protein AB1714_05235 [Acidobacteriota bacterium]